MWFVVCFVCGLLFWVWGYVLTRDAFPVAWVLQTTRFTRCLIRSECLNVKPCTAPAHTLTHTDRQTGRQTHTHAHTQTRTHALFLTHSSHMHISHSHLEQSFSCNHDACALIRMQRRAVQGDCSVGIHICACCTRVCFAYMHTSTFAFAT